VDDSRERGANQPTKNGLRNASAMVTVKENNIKEGMTFTLCGERNYKWGRAINGE